MAVYEVQQLNLSPIIKLETSVNLQLSQQSRPTDLRKRFVLLVPGMLSYYQIDLQESGPLEADTS